jgi:serine/threonine-protein kinase RsbW
MSTNEPNVRLKLSNRPENVALVRAVLAGIAEAIGLDAEQLDDIRTAVTEACNNAVLHAYEGGEGPLEVDVRLPAEGRVAVVVRDAGIGIEPRGEAPAAEAQGPEELEGDVHPRPGMPGMPDEESLKLGLHVIQALTTEVELRRPDGGGTEVQMAFATPGSRLPDRGDGARAGEAPSIELLPAIGPTGERPALIAAATIAIAPDDRLARTVLPRLVCALAVRANFSTERLADAQLVADVIAAEAFRAIIGSHLGVGIAVEPRRVELRVGPLPIDRESAAAADAALDELGVVVERLIDDHSIAPVGSAAVLALQLIDRR